MMKVINVEIKALCRDHSRIRSILSEKDAAFIGRDHQVDTYFKSVSGRLKLREGTIENNLIWYRRPDQAGPKTSHCVLLGTEKGSPLKDILEHAMGIMVVVDKHREIYFIDNIKIHLDLVEGLGSFVEIEAQSEEGVLTEEILNAQCTRLMEELGIPKGDLLTGSYSDLIMQKE
jgi:predicted adenylyl cyclase CyaB